MDTPTFTYDVESPGPAVKPIRMPYKFVYSETERDLFASFPRPMPSIEPVNHLVNMTYHPGPITISNATDIRPRHESELDHEEPEDGAGPSGLIL